ncbi:Monocarboxylate transporter 9 [Portunus trituberculatus]|uniref:Monocarboxylate transporter 9 n=1 Tax=Portunus trituberculatus TaxID=210409 RepID=A0A5B7D9L9_PORTR|nr:Monocarboxylate transporter 9 [Portunus trituberculatus]
MLLPSFGILFSQQLLEWRTSSTTIAVIFNTFLVVWRLAGVVMGTLAKEFGFRKVAVTGTLLTATSLTLSAFAASPTHLLITFSLGCGLGNGLSCVGYLILAHYFKERRGRATACLVAGAGLGHFISPLVIRLLQEEYGMRGATMILGGITLHAVVGACVFQPVEWHWKKPKKDIAVEDAVAFSSLLPSHAKTREPKTAEVKVANDSTENTDDPLCVAPSHRRVSQSYSTAAREDNPLPVHTVVIVAKTEAPTATSTVWRDRSGACGVCRTLGRVARSVMRDMRVLRKPTCLIIGLASSLIINAEANFLVMVPFALQAAGHPLQTAAWCLSIAGMSNLFTRLCVSALSDLPWFNMQLCYMAGMAVMAASVLAFTFQMGAVWYAAVMGVWGCAAGMFYGLNNLLMTRVVGLRYLISVYGARNLLGALGFFIVGPVVGVIRDASGCYSVSMWVLASLMSFSFFLWLLMPAAQAYENRQEPQERSSTHRQATY